MKKNFIAIAAAVVLLSAPAAVTADAAETEGQSAESGMLMPSPKKKSAKKTTKKTTKKSTSSKKTTSKKSTSSKTATTTKAAEPQEGQHPALHRISSAESSRASPAAPAAAWLRLCRQSSIRTRLPLPMSS